VVLTTRTRRRAEPRIVVAKAAVHLAALTPLAILLWQMWGELKGVSHALGADPVAEIEHRLGLWALRFLMLTLAITPLRQLTGWNVLVRFRRMLGLYAFAYASLHFAAYLGLDLRGFWAQVFQDIVKRPYITVGFIAWLLLVPLAVTSTTGWIKRLGPQLGAPAQAGLRDRRAGGAALLVAGEVRPARTGAVRRDRRAAAGLARVESAEGARRRAGEG
jgi:sulfoxide reductase heme-binding subunit YedZ